MNRCSLALVTSLFGLGACQHAAAVSDAATIPTDAPGDGAALAQWRTPTGWRHEVMAFPLDFAPSLAHQGVEELRFPPGAFDLTSTNYWSYAFVWRTTDAAVLDAGQLSSELTAYYRGLLVAVDTNHLITTPDAIVAHATATATGFAFTAHLFDAFNQAQPVDVSGLARRVSCGTGALWVFELSPAAPQSPVRADLDQLSTEAQCGQPVPTT